MAEIQGLVIGFFHTQPDDQLEAAPFTVWSMSPFTYLGIKTKPGYGA